MTRELDAPTPHHTPEGVPFPKAIKTFVKRAGRTTTGQAKAFETLGPLYVLPYTGTSIDRALWGADRVNA